MSSRSTRRARRRAKAQLRDLTQHGTRDRAAAPEPRPVNGATMRAFRDALPETAAPLAKASAPNLARTYTVLQRIDAGRPYRRRRVRYSAVSQWRGHRLAPKP